ncbi:MAG: TIGR04283 family arsenosugar biosynthesis glycosyltransferase [Nitrospirota bacterium]|nr:TIGR04283 family arsenosugar biosynthesis glycosyltransferase [Nitrospirota bacterium]MDH5586341.1 TIGR04283 family arsenosugar biosynthesis glycosyltransferase [Nitrospirota bacterium]MDH5775825.1 TIGR04283 family arsenosugar biosynthesis glycosyltransferase [Nitrospirota bacterium]
MSMAVIIPVLNEEDGLPSLLQWLLSLEFEEIILVDGKSDDRTMEVAQAIVESSSHQSTRIFAGPNGRAAQMNAGAAQATADILLFLHADTQLPHNARHIIEQALSHPQHVGGRFDVRFPQDEGYAWMISRMMNVRSRLSGICTGDQAMFVRRAVFESMGGFADIPLMEDLEFSRRLKRKGSIVALRETVTTSFRRWEQKGPLRTIVQMWVLRLLYWMGWDPQRLHRYYAHVR